MQKPPSGTTDHIKNQGRNYSNGVRKTEINLQINQERKPSPYRDSKVVNPVSNTNEMKIGNVGMTRGIFTNMTNIRDIVNNKEAMEPMQIPPTKTSLDSKNDKASPGLSQNIQDLINTEIKAQMTLLRNELMQSINDANKANNDKIIKHKDAIEVLKENARKQHLFSQDISSKVQEFHISLGKFSTGFQIEIESVKKELRTEIKSIASSSAASSSNIIQGFGSPRSLGANADLKAIETSCRTYTDTKFKALDTQHRDLITQQRDLITQQRDLSSQQRDLAAHFNKIKEDLNKTVNIALNGIAQKICEDNQSSVKEQMNEIVHAWELNLKNKFDHYNQRIANIDKQIQDIGKGATSTAPRDEEVLLERLASGIDNKLNEMNEYYLEQIRILQRAIDCKLNEDAVRPIGLSVKEIETKLNEFRIETENQKKELRLFKTEVTSINMNLDHKLNDLQTRLYNEFDKFKALLKPHSESLANLNDQPFSASVVKVYPHNLNQEAKTVKDSKESDKPIKIKKDMDSIKLKTDSHHNHTTTPTTTISSLSPSSSSSQTLTSPVYNISTDYSIKIPTSDVYLPKKYEKSPTSQFIEYGNKESKGLLLSISNENLTKWNDPQISSLCPSTTAATTTTTANSSSTTPTITTATMTTTTTNTANTTIPNNITTSCILNFPGSTIPTSPERFSTLYDNKSRKNYLLNNIDEINNMISPKNTQKESSKLDEQLHTKGRFTLYKDLNEDSYAIPKYVPMDNEYHDHLTKSLTKIPSVNIDLDLTPKPVYPYGFSSELHTSSSSSLKASNISLHNPQDIKKPNQPIAESSSSDLKSPLQTPITATTTPISDLINMSISSNHENKHYEINNDEMKNKLDLNKILPGIMNESIIVGGGGGGVGVGVGGCDGYSGGGSTGSESNTVVEGESKEGKNVMMREGNGNDKIDEMMKEHVEAHLEPHEGKESKEANAEREGEVEEDEEETLSLVYQLDSEGYIMDEYGNYVLDDNKNKIKLTEEQLDNLKASNILDQA